MLLLQIHTWYWHYGFHDVVLSVADKSKVGRRGYNDAGKGLEASKTMGPRGDKFLKNE